jgi:protein-L-isoaspartate(D-aspartate) O-methyltransferase
MIDGQIKPNKVVSEALLDAMARIPREKFVPRHLQGFAYIDEDIPLGHGRALPEPMVIARLIQEAAVAPTDVVLDIGCGTGYSAALLSQLATTVVALESNREMAAQAESNLHELGIHNVAVIACEQLNAGYPQQAPFQVILINGSLRDVPTAILQQLSPGGRLITVQTAAESINGRMGQAIVMTRQGDRFETRALFDAALPQLPGFEHTKKFEF